jgi:uncharacterized protein YbaR (Trm112 family)
MHDYLIDMLVCPACLGNLAWQVHERDHKRILSAKASCRYCAAIYPIHEGIGLFLTSESSPDDLWQQVDTHLTQYLRAHPEVERQLMEPPLATLNPADLIFRALELEERGAYAEARAATDRANEAMYTAEYVSCWTRQVDYLIEQLSSGDEPIVDIASGRCALVEKITQRCDRPVVATDFSPRVLRHDRRRLEHQGLYDRVSLLAFDARHTPFKPGAVKTLTTNLGLPNIQEPGNLLGELRRITDGAFLAISYFYPEYDEANGARIHELGLEALLFRQDALARFAKAGWQVTAANACQGTARPTPTGVALAGAKIDALPVAETILEWCVLVGT